MKNFISILLIISTGHVLSLSLGLWTMDDYLDLFLETSTTTSVNEDIDKAGPRLVVPSDIRAPFITTESYYITSNNNDSEEDVPTGVIDRSSSDLELIYEEGDQSSQIVGLRYENIQIPQGTTITGAYITFKADESDNVNTSLTLWAEDSDDASPLTENDYDLSSRTKTTSSTSWNNIPSWSTGNSYTSPNLKSIIQEVVNRGGWTNGSDITILIEGTGTRVSESGSSGSSEAPILVLSFGPSETCWAVAQAENSGGYLYTWETNGGNTLIGNLGVQQVETMTMDGSCNVLHAINADVYGTIDLATGAFNATSVLGIMEANGIEENISDVDGLAIDDNTGYLWAIERKSSSNDLLFQINPATGKVVEDVFGADIDYVELVGALVDVDDIAFNPCTGQLVGISTVSGSGTYDQVVEINTSTGVLTVLATLNTCDIEGLTFNNDCDLFGSTGNDDQCATDNSVYQIDITNETTTLITTLGHNDVEALVCCVTAPQPPCIDLTNGGTIGYDEDVCAGTDVHELFNLASPSGGQGAIVYTWMYSTTTCNAPSGLNDPNWTEISNSNTRSYDPGVITQTTCYVRLARRDNCSVNVISNVVTATVVTCVGCVDISFTSVGTDDGEETLSDGNIDLGSSDLELVYDPEDGDQLVGIRFTSVNIPSGSTISSAYIEFTTDEISDSPTDIYIQAEDIDDAPTISNTDYNLSNRTKTTEVKAWTDVDPWFFEGEKHITPNFHNVIQEVVDRPGWSTGNDIMILLSGSGRRVAESFNGSNSNAPKIYITFCDPPPDIPDPVCYPGEIGQPSIACPSYDPSVISNIESANAKCSYIDNGEFDNGASGWGLYAHAGSAATLSIDNTNQLSGTNSAHANITVASDTIWKIQLYNEPHTVSNGQLYEVSFDAKSNGARVLQVVLQLRQDPWTTYWSETINLNSSSQSFSWTGIDLGVTHTNIGLIFNMAQSTNDVWVDKVAFGPDCGSSFTTYEWQSREDDGAGGWTSWMNIGGATSSSYDPPVIDKTTQWRRRSNINICNEWQTSNEVEATYSIPTVSFNLGDDEECVSSTNLILTGGLPANGTYSGLGVTDSIFDASVAGAGMHAITYTFTDGSGCSDFAIDSIEVLASPSVTISGDDWMCFGQTKTLTAVGFGGGGSPYSYEWNNDLGSGQSKDIDTTTTTTYIVTVTDSNGCTNTAEHVMGVRDIVTDFGTISGDQAGCESFDPVIITGTVYTTSGPNITPVYRWEWSTDSTNWNEINPTNTQDYDPAPITETTYYRRRVYMNNSCGNQVGNVVTLTVNDNPSADAGADQTICNGGTAVLTATGGTFYSWSGAAGDTATVSVSPSSTTTYTVTVTDNNGCTDEANVVITVESEPTITVSDENICTGETATLTGTTTGGIGTVSYQWQASVNGNTWEDISGATNINYTTPNLTQATYYRLTADWTATGCSGITSNTALVSVDPGAIVGGISLSEPLVCAGESITLTVNETSMINGGEIDHSSWTVGTGSVGTFNRLSSDDKNHRINGTDPWGNSTVIWEARPDDAWNADGGWNSTQFDIDHTQLYRVSVWVNRKVMGTDGKFYLGTRGYGSINGLERVTNGLVNENPYLYVSPGPPTLFGEDEWVLVVGHIRPSDHVGTTNHTDSGLYKTSQGKFGNISLDYRWLPETTTAVHRSYLFYCTDTTARQQWLFPRFDLVDGSEPSVDDLLMGFDSNDGEPAGVNWTWHTGSCDGTQVGTGKSITVSPTSTTTYYVKASGACNSPVCESVEVEVNDLPDASTGDQNDICSGDTLTWTAIDAGSGAIYDWAFGPDATPQTATGIGPHDISYTISGGSNVNTTTTLTVTDANGCINTGTDAFDILVAPDVQLSLPQNDICSGEDILLLTGGTPANGTYSGLGVSGDTLYLALAGPGTHTITYSFTNGSSCTAYDTDEIEIFSQANLTLDLNTGNVCEGSGLINLTGGSPAGGTYSGLGVSGGSIDPSIAGIGTHTITYTLTDANGCTGLATDQFSVIELPTVTLSDESICDGESITLDPDVCEHYQDIVAQRPLAINGWQNVFGVGGSGLTGDGELCFTLDDAILSSANMLGLNTDPHTDNNYTSIDYAIYVNIRDTLANPYRIFIREDGTNKATIYNSAVSYVGSTFCVKRTGTTIEYLMDGVIIYTSTVPSTGTLYYDHSIHSNTTGQYAGGYSKFTNISLCGDVDLDYDWNTGATSETLNINTADTYTVEVTDNKGCISTAQSVVTVNSISNPTATKDGDLQCDDAIVQLTATPVDMNYAWTGPNSFVSSSRTPTVVEAGTYQVVITDLTTGCKDSTSVDVDLLSNGFINSVSSGCTTEDIVVNYTISGSETQAWIGIYEINGANENFLVWSWVPTIPGTDDLTFSNHGLSGGTYEARLYSTSGYVLCMSDQFTIDDTPIAVADNDGNLTCENSVVQLSALPENLTYSWTGPNSFSSNLRTPDATEPGIYTVTITNTSTSCSDVATTEVILESQGSITGISSACSHDVISVDYNIIGTATQAWIGIYNVNAPNNSFLVWSWVPTIPGTGTVEFTDHDLAAGPYEARLFSTGGYILCENEQFDFGQTPDCTISGRSFVPEGSQNEVYSAAPGNSYTWTILSGDATIDGVNNTKDVTIDFGLSTSELELVLTTPQGCSSTCTILINISPNGKCLYRDEFITQTYDNSDGTEDWSTDSWIEIGDDGDPLTGDIVIDNQAVRLDHDDSSLPSVERAIDLSGIANAALSFDYYQGIGDLESNDVVEVHIYDGTTWHLVLSDSGTIPPNSSPTLDISAYADANSKIRISIASGYADDVEFVFFDNIMILGDCIVPEICNDGIDNDFDGVIDCPCQQIITNRHIYYRTTIN